MGMAWKHILDLSLKFQEVFVSARLASTRSYSHSGEGTMLFQSHSCVMFHLSPSLTNADFTYFSDVAMCYMSRCPVITGSCIFLFCVILI